MNKQKVKYNKKERRHRRVRAKIIGTKECPRLSVFRSDRNLFVQLIDDQSGHTLASAHSNEIKFDKKKNAADPQASKKIAIGHELGNLIAQKALAKKIKIVVFDRGSYKYHGRVKAVAEGARAGGLKF